MGKFCSTCERAIYRYNKSGICKQCFHKSTLGLANVRKAISASTASRTAKTLSERLAKYQIKKGADECWGWSGCHNGVGYAVLRIDKKIRVATHISLELSGMARPSADHCACHHCDNPICTNPAHLFWGTHQENMDDAVAKGRTRNQNSTSANGFPVTERAA